jgi:MFS family permease
VERETGVYRWVAVLLLWLVCFFNYADRQALFSIFPLLQSGMGLTTVQLGLLGSSFAVVYGLGAPLAGFVVDRIRRKTAILGGLELWSVICMLSAWSRNFAQLFTFRALEGAGETFYYPAALSMLSDYHGQRTRSRALGLLQTSVYAGTVGGGYWAGVLAERHGWRAAIFLFGALGALLGLVLIRWLREPARGSADRGSGMLAMPAPRPLAFRSMGAVFKVKTVVGLMAAFASANFLAMVLMTWMPAYLYGRFHLSLAVAAVEATAFTPLASMAGSAWGGYKADLMARRHRGGRILVQSVGVFAGAPFVVLCGLGGSLSMVILALVCWGFFKGMYDSNIFASAFDVVPAEHRGTVSGWMNCVGWLVGGGLAPVVIGVMATHMSLGHAIATASAIYLLAGVFLVTTMRLFLPGDARRHATV